MAKDKEVGKRIRYKMKKNMGSHVMQVRLESGRIEKRTINWNDKDGGLVTVDHPRELGGAIDKFECLDTNLAEKALTKSSDVDAPLKLTIESRGDMKFDVINTRTGRTVNDIPLSKSDAEKLVKKVTNENLG